MTVAPSLSPPASPGRPALPSATLLPSAGCTLRSPAGVGKRGQLPPASDRAAGLPTSTSPVPGSPKGTGREEARQGAHALGIVLPWRFGRYTTAREQLSHPGKAGSPADCWVVTSDFQGKAASGRKTTTRLQRWLQSDPLGASPLAEPRLVLPTPTSQKSQGKDTLLAVLLREKGSQRCSLPTMSSFMGRKHHDKNGLCHRIRRGVPGGTELGILPIPSFPPRLPPPSPAALDCCGSRGYDRASSQGQYQPGILGRWISLPIARMQQGLEDEVETCGAQGWVTGTASLVKVTGLGGGGWRAPTFPGQK